MASSWVVLRDESLLRNHLWRGRGFVLGRFVCRPGHPAWRTDNEIGTEALVVLPGRPVEIAQQGRPRVVANAGVAMFYDAGRVYGRRLVDPGGDACHYLGLSRATMAEISRHHGAATGDDLFPWPRGPVRAELRLRFERLVRAIDGGLADELDAEEEVIDLVGTLVADAVAAHRGGPVDRGAADVRHREATRHLEAVISRRFREHLSVDDLAVEVGLSPFHAARLFRRYTGTSMHAYRDQLRLRAALPRLDRGARLDELALELGFCSHAHFTDRFRRAFGVPPSAARS